MTVLSQRSSNSLVLREVNERIFELLRHFGSEDGRFLCECSDKSCFETFPLTLSEYVAIQAQPDSPPLKLPGHPD